MLKWQFPSTTMSLQREFPCHTNRPSTRNVAHSRFQEALGTLQLHLCSDLFDPKTPSGALAGGAGPRFLASECWVTDLLTSGKAPYRRKHWAVCHPRVNFGRPFAHFVLQQLRALSSQLEHGEAAERSASVLWLKGTPRRKPWNPRNSRWLKGKLRSSTVESTFFWGGLFKDTDTTHLAQCKPRRNHGTHLFVGHPVKIHRHKHTWKKCVQTPL